MKKITGMTECKICGNVFPLKDVNHYIARDNKLEGGFNQAVCGQEEPQLYDAFTCPHCGCQYIAQERKRLLEASYFEEVEDAQMDNQEIADFVF